MNLKQLVIKERFAEGAKHTNILYIVSIALAIILRVKFEINYPKLNWDYAFSALKAKNFMEGHGFTNGIVNLKNMSEIKYETWNWWPNGFSIALVPLYYLTGSLITSMILLQVAGVVLLLFGFIRLLNLLDLSKFTQSIFLLFTAFTATPYSYLGTTDLLTATLFLWVLVLTIEVCSTEKKNNAWKKIIIGSLLFSSAALRYASIPNIIIIPCLFIFLGLVKKDRKELITGIEILFYAAIPAFLFFSFYTIYSGRMHCMYNLIHFKFNWELLKWMDAFPLKAFFYTSPLEFRLPFNQLIITIVRLSEYIGAVIILGYLCWYFVKKRDWLAGLKQKNKIDIFTVLSILSFIVIVGFISMQTLTTPAEPMSPGPHWMPHISTYVYFTRYFVIVIFLIQIFFFLLMDGVFKRTINVTYAPAFVLLLFVSSLLVNVIYWGYTIYEYQADKSMYSYWSQGKDMITLHRIINLDAEKNPGVNIIVAPFWGAAVENDPSMFSWSTTIAYQHDSIIQEKLQHTKPVILYVMMPGNKLTEQDKKFISDFNAVQVLQWKDGGLYGQGCIYRAYLY